MASIYELKPRFQGLLRPLTTKLATAGVTANQVTVFACVFSVVLAVLIALFHQTHWIYLILPFALFLRMAFNAIDGMLAREFEQASDLGAVLNEICDVVSDIALALAFVPYFQNYGAWHGWPVVVALLGVVNEFCGVLGHALGVGRRYDGPGGKSDRAFALGLAGVIIALGFDHRLAAMGVSALFAALSLLIVISSVKRLSASVRGSKDLESTPR